MANCHLLHNSFFPIGSKKSAELTRIPLFLLTSNPREVNTQEHAIIVHPVAEYATGRTVSTNFRILLGPFYVRGATSPVKCINESFESTRFLRLEAAPDFISQKQSITQL